MVICSSSAYSNSRMSFWRDQPRIYSFILRSQIRTPFSVQTCSKKFFQSSLGLTPLSSICYSERNFSSSTFRRRLLAISSWMGQKTCVSLVMRLPLMLQRPSFVSSGMLEYMFFTKSLTESFCSLTKLWSSCIFLMCLSYLLLNLVSSLASRAYSARSSSETRSSSEAL